MNFFKDSKKISHFMSKRYYDCLSSSKYDVLRHKHKDYFQELEKTSLSRYFINKRNKWGNEYEISDDKKINSIYIEDEVKLNKR